MNDASHVEIPDAVMSAFTAAFGSVAKVRELEAKVRDLEDNARRSHEVEDKLRSERDDLTAHSQTLEDRIKAMEVSLADATKSKAEADSRIGLILDALRGVASEATAAVSLVEPPKPEPEPVPEPTTHVPATHMEDYSTSTNPTPADGATSTVVPAPSDGAGAPTPIVPTASVDVPIQPSEVDSTQSVPFATSAPASQSPVAPSGLAELAVPQSADASSHDDLAWLRTVGVAS